MYFLNDYNIKHYLQPYKDMVNGMKPDDVTIDQYMLCASRATEYTMSYHPDLAIALWNERQALRLAGVLDGGRGRHEVVYVDADPAFDPCPLRNGRARVEYDNDTLRYGDRWTVQVENYNVGSHSRSFPKQEVNFEQDGTPLPFYFYEGEAVPVPRASIATPSVKHPVFKQTLKDIGWPEDVVDGLSCQEDVVKARDSSPFLKALAHPSINIGMNRDDRIAAAEQLVQDMRAKGQSDVDLVVRSKNKMSSLDSVTYDPDFGVIQDGHLRKYFGKGGDVVVPDGVRVVDKYAFLNSAHAEKVTSVVLPEGCETLQSESFRDCKNLKRVYFPASIKAVASDAFCSSGLKDIGYGGTQADWNTNVDVYFSGLTWGGAGDRYAREAKEEMTAAMTFEAAPSKYTPKDVIVKKAAPKEAVSKEATSKDAAPDVRLNSVFVRKHASGSKAAFDAAVGLDKNTMAIVYGDSVDQISRMRDQNATSSIGDVQFAGGRPARRFEIRVLGEPTQSANGKTYRPVVERRYDTMTYEALAEQHDRYMKELRQSYRKEKTAAQTKSRPLPDTSNIEIANGDEKERTSPSD